MLTSTPRPHAIPTTTSTTYQPTFYSVTPTTNQATYPQVSVIGPYAIKCTEQLYLT